MQTKTPTGCRPVQLLGPWMMEQEAYDALMDQASLLIGAGSYEIVARESREMANETAKQPLYESRDGVANFAITGPMTRYPTSMQAVLGGTSTLNMQRAVRLAADDGLIRAGFIDINSPGGTADGMEDFCVELARFRSKKPLAMHISGVGASAALRIAMEADVLTIDPMGIAGSVGTMTRLRDTSKLMERAGVKVHYIASGDRKVVGQPGQEVTEQQVAERKALIDAINRNFIEAVERRRPQTKKHMEDISRAGLYDARRAVEVGLVDSVSTTDQAFSQFTQRIPFHGGRTLPGKVPSFY